MKEKIKELLMDVTDSVTDSCKESDSLIESGILSSMDMVTLVGELEEEWNIELDAEDIVPENFETINAIVSMIERYKG